MRKDSSNHLMITEAAHDKYDLSKSGSESSKCYLLLK